MPRRFARYALAALAFACQSTFAQTATTGGATPGAQVQQLAPQLLVFAGSQANFDNLVNGLAQGTQVQLTTVLPEGFTQVVTFTPSAPLTPLQIAQTLETARQQLIGLGIAAPTAEQIGITLMGGRVPTALGGTQVAGALPAAARLTTPESAAAGATSSSAAVTSAVTVQLVPNPPAAATATTPTTTTPGVARINTSDSNVPAGATSRTPIPASNTPTTPAPPPAILTPPSLEPARTAPTPGIARDK